MLCRLSCIRYSPNNQHDLAKLSSSYLKVVRFLAFIGFPLSVFLWFSAHEVVLTVFGGQWEPSVPVFRILTTTVGIQVVLSTSGSVFQAAGQTKMLFISGLLSAVLNVGAICAGIFAYGSLEAVAWGISMSFAVNFVQCYYLMFYRTFHLPWGPFWARPCIAFNAVGHTVRGSFLPVVCPA